MLSIIIPCYNDGKYIEEAVNSALMQSYMDKEIIVIDDGSDQRTKNVLSTIKNRVDQLIFQENQGVGAARNTGIKSASGKYILVLDADDYFEYNFAKEAIERLKADADIVLVSCWSRWFLNDRDYRIFKPSGGDLKNYLFKNNAMGSVLFKKESWDLVGGYDEIMEGYEDWEFYLRLHQNGGYTYIIEKILFHYRNKPKSRNKIATLKKNELINYIFTKNSEIYKDNFDSLLHWFFSYYKENEELKGKTKNSNTLGKIISKLRNLIGKISYK